MRTIFLWMFTRIVFVAFRVRVMLQENLLELTDHPAISRNFIS